MLRQRVFPGPEVVARGRFPSSNEAVRNCVEVLVGKRPLTDSTVERNSRSCSRALEYVGCNQTSFGPGVRRFDGVLCARGA